MEGEKRQRQPLKGEEMGITNIKFLRQFWYCVHAISARSPETNTFQSQKGNHITIRKTQAICEARVSSAP